MGNCADTDMVTDKSEPIFVASRKPVLSGHEMFEDNEGITTISLNVPLKGSDSNVPNVPVVFVLGGPGSGKVTHCKRLSEERRGLVYINMSDVLQKYISSSGTSDVAMLPSNKVTDVLSGEFRHYTSAEGFIITGFPRNMKDVSEYLEKIGRCDGVILLNWHDSTLERQIAYGARIGRIDLDEANIELENFRRLVFQVAEYFDYKDILYVITGERQPNYVYGDFVMVYDRILVADKKILGPRPASTGTYRNFKEKKVEENGMSSIKHVLSSDHKIPDQLKMTPMVLWIIGGPGSNMEQRVSEVADSYPKWHHVSGGDLLWDYLEQHYPNGLDAPPVDGLDDDVDRTLKMVKKAMHYGEFVPHGVVLDLVLEEMENNATMEGFLVTGYPRTSAQVKDFEKRTGSCPVIVLIDCSELELSKRLGRRRGRMDDNVDAYKHRLSLYREHTLPMIKKLDAQNRVRIIDGDAEQSTVVDELKKNLHKEITFMKQEKGIL